MAATFGRPSKKARSRHKRWHLYGGMGLPGLIVVSTAIFGLSYLYRLAENRAYASGYALSKSLELTFTGMVDSIDVALRAAAIAMEEVAHHKISAA